MKEMPMKICLKFGLTSLEKMIFYLTKTNISEKRNKIYLTKPLSIKLLGVFFFYSLTRIYKEHSG